MTTKRTDGQDEPASSQEDGSLGEFLKHANAPVLSRAPVGTVPPPAGAAEVLVTGASAETVVTPNPTFTDPDEGIELLEDSGLLTLEPDEEQAQPVETRDLEEVSSSFLVEDLDGYVDLGVDAAEVEEVGSEHLDFVETQGEIVLEYPRATVPVEPEVDLQELHRESFDNDSAQYSTDETNGVPVMVRSNRGSSKTLRVAALPSPRKPWIQKAGIAAMFVLGTGAGVLAFSMMSKSDTAPEPAVQVQEAAPVVAESVVAGAEDDLPVVAPLVMDDEVEAEAEAEAEAEMPIEVEAAEAEAEAPAEVEAEAPAEVEVEAPAEAPAEVEAEAEAEVKAPAAKKRANRRAKANEKKSEKKSVDLRKESAADPGTLMLAAKPPCQIRIDGKTTGLMTPQRVLRLSPGNHRITLVNREHKIRDSFKVSIVSGKKTRIVRDNTNKIK